MRISSDEYDRIREAIESVLAKNNVRYDEIPYIIADIMQILTKLVKVKDLKL